MFVVNLFQTFIFHLCSCCDTRGTKTSVVPKKSFLLGILCLKEKVNNGKSGISLVSDTSDSKKTGFSQQMLNL